MIKNIAVEGRVMPCPACGGTTHQIKDEQSFVCTEPGGCVWSCWEDMKCGREDCGICHP